jgi:predicted nucleic acid-binding Zn ribbon protein
MSNRTKCPNCGAIIKPQILAILILLGIAGLARADHIIPTDKAAHFGISYALQTTGYGVLKGKGFDKTDSIILSARATFGLGLCWESFGPTPPNKGDVLANTLGQAAAITTIISFDF